MPVPGGPLAIEPRRGTIYPDPFKKGCEDRLQRALTGPLGLPKFGCPCDNARAGRARQNATRAGEDQCVYVLSGEVVLVTDEAERFLNAGMAAHVPAGVPNGRHLINRGTAPVTYHELGTRSPDDVATYPDIDLHLVRTKFTTTLSHKNGDPH